MISTSVVQRDFLIGHEVETPHGRGLVCNTTESYVAVFLLQTGELKRYARLHCSAIRVVEPLDPEDRIDRMFLRINEPGQKHCEMCGRAIWEPLSVAVGTGPCCRKPDIERRREEYFHAALRQDLEAMDMDDETLASICVLPFWKPNA